MVEDYDYDGTNRLEKLTAKLGQQVLFEQDYTLLPDGQRDYVIERRWDAATSTFSVTKIDWEYDALNRLTEEVRDEGNDGPDSSDYRHVFSYDLAGNRLSKRIDTGNDGSIDQVTAYRYNARDQLVLEWIDANDNGLPDEATITSYAYDDNGNTTAKGASSTYTWDLRGRMSSATVNGTVTGYAYDHAGQRISFTAASGPTTYLLNDGNNPTGYPQIIEERQGISPQSATLSRSYMAGLRMEGQFDGQGATFFLRDGHGSNRALLDDGGNVIAAFDYQAFGEAIGFDPALAGTTQLFGGDAEFDAGSGNYYHDKRWRRDFAFLSFDDYENPDPRGLHKYLYANANPVSNIDPSGHLSYTEIGVATGIMAILTYTLWSQLTLSGQYFHGRWVKPSGWNAWWNGQTEIRKFRDAHLSEIHCAYTYRGVNLDEVFDDYTTIYPRVTSRACGGAQAHLEEELKSYTAAKPEITQGVVFAPAIMYLNSRADGSPMPEPDNILILVPTQYNNWRDFEQLGNPSWYDTAEKKNIIFFYAGSAPLIPVAKLYDAISNGFGQGTQFNRLDINHGEQFPR